MSNQKLPSGWTNERVKELVEHYDSQADQAAGAEDASASEVEAPPKSSSEGGKSVAPREEYFVEQRPDGRYNVARHNALRASAVTDTKAEAIAKAKQLSHGSSVHVE